MKSLVILCVVALVGLSAAGKIRYRRDCIYVNGHCSRQCEEGTHTYSSACRQKIPEPTCAEPNPKPEGGHLCDYFACYCNPPTVRNTQTKKCVPLEECPKSEE